MKASGLGVVGSLGHALGLPKGVREVSSLKTLATFAGASPDPFLILPITIHVPSFPPFSKRYGPPSTLPFRRITGVPPPSFSSLAHAQLAAVDLGVRELLAGGAERPVVLDGVRANGRVAVEHHGAQRVGELVAVGQPRVRRAAHRLVGRRRRVRLRAAAARDDDDDERREGRRELRPGQRLSAGACAETRGEGAAGGALPSCSGPDGKGGQVVVGRWVTGGREAS